MYSCVPSDSTVIFLISLLLVSLLLSLLLTILLLLLRYSRITSRLEGIVPLTARDINIGAVEEADKRRQYDLEREEGDGVVQCQIHSQTNAQTHTQTRSHSEGKSHATGHDDGQENGRRTPPAATDNVCNNAVSDEVILATPVAARSKHGDSEE